MPWFVQAGREPVLVPESMPDTLTRLRREGWAEVPDPRVAPEVLPAEPLLDPDPARTRARREEADEQAVTAVKARNKAARKWVEGKQ